MTAETKWTPGPWTTEVNEKAAAIRILGRHSDASRNRISDGLGEIVDVDCSAADNEDAVFAPMLEEQIANANLIAAAPDLYEALSALVRRWIDPGSISTEHWQNAAAALRKARGEQP